MNNGPDARQHPGDQERAPIDLEHVLNSLRSLLPAVATDLIKLNQDMSEPLNQAFAENPDNPLEHASKWHQYGILTHSEEFRRVITGREPGEARAYTQEWGVEDEVADILSERINGTPKEDLLQVSSLLHDMGKFPARELRSKRGDGVLSRFYTDHEAHSGMIIRHDLKEDLASLGLDDEQIEHVAACAELHFELGKVRREARDGFTMQFARSEECKGAIQEIIEEHPDYAAEIGLMFIADSLSKTEIMALPGTDEEIQLQRPDLEAKIASRGLHRKLIDQALTQPVNLEVAKRYFEIWSDMRRSGSIQPAEASE